MRDHIIDAPMDDALSSGRDALFAWTVSLHNAVNRSLGRNEVSNAWAWRRYRRGFLSARTRRQRASDMLAGGFVAMVVVFAALVFVPARSRL